MFPPERGMMEKVPAHLYGIRTYMLESGVDGLAQQGWTRVFDKAAKVSDLRKLRLLALLTCGFYRGLVCKIV